MSRIVLALILCLFSTSAALAERRVALVIGNSDYPTSPLRNPVNDARAMTAKLKGLGFSVISRENATFRDMQRAIREFSSQLSAGGEVGLVYYAGHGIQSMGRNYLVPVDAQIANEGDISVEAVDLDIVMTQLSQAQNPINIVILDACRNNPFERSFRSGGGNGLASVNAPTGTLIAYATAPGKVAADGDGSNGLYTEQLLTALSEPGLKVEDVFKRVRSNVMQKSSRAQIPWESSSLTGDFYFSPPTAQPAVLSVPQPQVPAPGGTTAEVVFWQTIMLSRNAADYQEYLRRYPQGQYVGLAQSRLAGLNAAPQQTARPPSGGDAGGEVVFWQTIMLSRNPADYEEYLRRFPQGQYAGLARSRLDGLHSRSAEAPAQQSAQQQAALAADPTNAYTQGTAEKSGVIGGVSSSAGTQVAAAAGLSRIQGIYRQRGGTCEKPDYVWTQVNGTRFNYQCIPTDLGSCDFERADVTVTPESGGAYKFDYPGGIWERARISGDTLEFFESSGGYRYTIERCE
ncbi:caspase family protein [Zavarzinia sp. CC-PAN008]|uniref:caspase family protein n=1 Tax=Zavarzinia sp. CC-PAN008 TaxID=3243332 RepID=UPI003F74723B